MSISSTNKQNTQTNLNKVYIYLRNYKKIANLVSVNTPITNHQLKTFISKQLLQKEQTFALFINGVRIDAYPGENSNIKNKSIIHVVNLDRINTESINIYFKFAKESKTILTVKTTPNTKIKSVFDKEVLPFFQKKEKQIFLAYLGKAISIFKTFKQQYIEDECQILLLEFNKEVIKQFEIINQSYHQSKNEINKTVVVGNPSPGQYDHSTIIMQRKKKSERNKQKLNEHMKPQQKQKQQTTAPQQQKIQINSSFNPSDCAPSQEKPHNSNLQPNKYSLQKPSIKQQTAPYNFTKKINIPQQIQQQ